MKEIQYYLFCVIGACFFGHRELYRTYAPGNLQQQPITICVIGVMLSILLSHGTNFYLGGLLEGGTEFAKVVVYYLLLVALVDTPQKLRILLQSTVISSTVMVSFSLMDYLNFSDFPLITHIIETHGTDLLGREIKITRMCGTGMFHDPNDISLIIVTMSIISIYFLMEPVTKQTRNAGIVAFSKVFWLIPLAILISGLVCTQSRGGLLAMGAALLAWSTIRFGKLPAIVALVLGIISIPFVLGRQGDISLTSGTGQARIRLWSDGLVSIQNHRFIFGLGEGMYDDVAGLVAHNSYIHAFVELGYVGGTFFLGCFFFAAYGLWKIQKDNIPSTTSRIESIQSLLCRPPRRMVYRNGIPFPKLHPSYLSDMWISNLLFPINRRIHAQTHTYHSMESFFCKETNFMQPVCLSGCIYGGKTFCKVRLIDTVY